MGSQKWWWQQLDILQELPNGEKNKIEQTLTTWHEQAWSAAFPGLGEFYAQNKKREEMQRWEMQEDMEECMQEVLKS